MAFFRLLASLLVLLLSLFLVRSRALATDPNAANLVTSLPGAPAHAFRQYSGYITVSKTNGRKLFYWLVEATRTPEKKPLTLWLNGGPGCSSVGSGALSELGPFFTNANGSGLIQNPYSWNSESNLLFLESPAGVGFSVSSTPSDYFTGDAKTAEDTLTFLRLWLQQYARYKGRDFFITGESYAGHYIPQLALLILKTAVPLQASFKGFAVGNPWTDPVYDNKGQADFWWERGLISDSSHLAIYQKCNFSVNLEEDEDCGSAYNLAYHEMGNINQYSIYQDVCLSSAGFQALRLLQHRRRKGAKLGQMNAATGDSVPYNPCISDDAGRYLNRGDTQKALHAKATDWSICSYNLYYDAGDYEISILPIYRQLVKYKIRIWVYTGDVDSVVPITGTRYWLNQLTMENTLVVSTQWQPWYYNNQVGGRTESYNNGAFRFVTVRNAGHMVPYDQPARALVLFRQFIAGMPMPSS